MKIIHVPRRFVATDWGGTETAVLEMAKGLLARGYDTEIVTSAALGEAGVSEVEGIPVRRFEHFYPYFGLSDEARHQLDLRGGNLFSSALLRYLLRCPGPSVFHLHTGKRLGGIVRTAARLRDLPYVVSLHGGVVDVPQDEQQRWTEPTQGLLEWGKALGAVVGARRVLDDAAAILCVNRAEQEALQKRYPGKRVLWMPNAVTVARYRNGWGAGFRQRYGIPANHQVILNVGRIDPQKDQLRAVEVFERVATSGDVHLVLIGSATDLDYFHKLTNRIGESRFADNIHLVGALPAGCQELINAYQAADLFLLTSIHEPFGIVILESWAAGTPVVAPAIGGVPSFVEHGTTGLLFSGSGVDQAESYVRLMLTNPGLAERIRDAASVMVHRFDSSRLLDSLIGLYSEVADERLVRA